jgi:hypothetical protein
MAVTHLKLDRQPIPAERDLVSKHWLALSYAGTSCSMQWRLWLDLLIGLLRFMGILKRFV